MARFDLRARRLIAQQIARRSFAHASEVVTWLGAMQAQDYASAKWALAVRLPAGANEQAIERAIAGGEVLRMHAMRGTWQLIAPKDVRWILGLVAPVVLAGAARRHRQLGLDTAVIRKSSKVIEKALGGGRHLTREELREVLARARVPVEGQRFVYLLLSAELEGLITSGAPRGKRPTYAALDDRAPAGRTIDRPEAIAELARRYFTSRGPATAADFAWWSGLTVRESRSGLEAIAPELSSQTIDARTYWFKDLEPARAGGLHLLPAFDEYLIAYQNREAVLDPRHTKRINAGGGLLAPTIVDGGRVVGTWKRTLGRSSVAVEFQYFERPTPARARAVERAAKKYAAFLGLDLAR